MTRSGGSLRSPRRRRRLDLARSAQSRPRRSAVGRASSIRISSGRVALASARRCPTSTDHRAARRPNDARARRRHGASARTGCARSGLHRLRRVGPARQAPAQAGHSIQRRSDAATDAVGGGAGCGDVAAALRRSPRPPVVRSRQLLLGPSLSEGRSSRPKVRAICVSPSGVTFWLRAEAEAGEPLGGSTASKDGTAWHVGHDALQGQDPCFPVLPVVLPMGDDEEGTWLVPLEPGDVLPLLGEAAPRHSGGPPGGRRIVGLVGDHAGRRGSRRPRDCAPRPCADPSVARHVLFCGDPAALAVGSRGTLRSGHDCSRWRPAPDRAGRPSCRNPSSHGTGRPPSSPIGRNGPAHRRTDRAAGRARSAEPRTSLDTPSRRLDAVGDPDDRPDGARPCPVTGSSRRPPPDHDAAASTDSTKIFRPIGPVGPSSWSPIWPCTNPTSITSDRLRTRCSGRPTPTLRQRRCSTRRTRPAAPWGSTSTAIRSFPPGTRQGLYQVSPHVTVDVQRAVVLAAEGKTQSDPAAAIAYLRAALELVEGEPLANALSGYAWWEAEGHGGRIAAVLVDAACIMAALAADARLFDLARWGLEQARLVEPYSEALSRAAMQVAAAEGTPTASAWNGATASAASTPSTPAARRRRGPRRSTESCRGGSSSGSHLADDGVPQLTCRPPSRLGARLLPHARTTSSSRATRLPFTSAASAGPGLEERATASSVPKPGLSRRARSGSPRPRSPALRPTGRLADARPRSPSPARP